MVKLLHVTTVSQSLHLMAGQADYMRSRGIDTSAVSSPDKYLESYSTSQRVAVHAITMSRRITPLADLRSLFFLWRHLRRERPDIVHSHTPKGGLLGMIAAWLARVPLRVYHIRGLPLATKTGWRRTLLRFTEKISCRLAHRVLCVSWSLAELAATERLCPSHKLKVLAGGSGNGVDARRRFNPVRTGEGSRKQVRKQYGVPDDAMVVGFVGRIVRDKGLIELAAAYKMLRDRFPALHLLIAGDFESEDPIPAEVERLLRRDDRIHLAGCVDDMPSFYTAVDLLALPTYREGFPNVLLEAAAMELSVVAAKVTGCVDAVLDGTTGTLVPAQDSLALSEAMQTYLESPLLRHKHGRAGRKRVVREFRQECIWQALYEEYLDLLGSRESHSLRKAA